jgi:putative membrane protein
MKTLLGAITATLALGTAYAQTTPMPNNAPSNSNQAVATTRVDAPVPAKGANSFTMSQAAGRIRDRGFSNVTGLTKDPDGIWRGNAEKDGTTTTVWLDYKGNVGTP